MDLLRRPVFLDVAAGRGGGGGRLRPRDPVGAVMSLFLPLSLLILQSLQTVLSSGMKIDTRAEHLFAFSGDNLTLPCTILEGENYNPFLNPIIWYKLGPDRRKPVQINTGAVISKPFDETGRYNIEPNMTMGENPTVQMPLILTEIQLSENGTYKCELRSRDKILSSVKHRLTIMEHVSSLDFTSNVTKYDNASRSLMFELEESTPSSVGCRVEGGNPAPHLRIMHGKKDISDWFDFSQRSEVRGSPGLQVRVYTSELRTDQFMVTEQWRGSVLKCVAKVPRWAKLRKIQTATIEVIYRPKVFCDRDKVISPETRNVSVTCRIKANPAVNPASIQWQYNALVAVRSNASAPATPPHKEDPQQHNLKFNASYAISNDSKADSRQRGSVKTVAAENETWDAEEEARRPQVWKVVRGMKTGQGSPGYSIDTSVDPESGEIISTLFIHNVSRHVFQTYYIIVENFAGRTRHGVRVMQEGHEFPVGVGLDRNDCGAVKFSPHNNTITVNEDVFNSSSGVLPCLFISEIREFFLRAPRAYFLTWPVYEVLIWLFELVYPNS